MTSRPLSLLIGQQELCSTLKYMSTRCDNITHDNNNNNNNNNTNSVCYTKDMSDYISGNGPCFDRYNIGMSYRYRPIVR